MTDRPPPHPFHGKVPTRLGLRVNLLFVLPFLFLLSFFFAETLGRVYHLLSFGLMMLSAWLTREGVRAQSAYDQRMVARRPAFPRKIAGSLAMGLGLGVAASWQGGLDEGLILGVFAGGLHFLSFGPDPLSDKGITSSDRDAARVARAVETAETELRAMAEAVTPLRDRQLEDRIDRFHITAREMFRTVEQDPRDLTTARRFMGVYLSGAREATEKFVHYYQRSRAPQARDDYLGLLDDLETNFAAKTRKLLLNDHADLSIEIETLRERLARETLTDRRTPQ